MVTRPTRLGKDFEIKTTEDVDAVLHELGWLDSLEAEVRARLQAAIEKLTAEHTAKLVLTIDDQELTVAHRAASLRSALATWCEANLAEHLKGDAKSLTLSHGTIGTRSLPDCVVCDDKKVIAAVETKVKLKALIVSWLATKLGAITLAGVIRIKTEVNKVEAKKLWDQGGNVQRSLQALGVTVETGRCSLVIEPNAQELTAPMA